MVSKFLTITKAYRNNDMKGFLRFLLLKERKKRIHYLDRILSWYYKQLFIAQCTSVGEGLKFIGRAPISVILSENGKVVIGKDVTVKSTCRFSVVTHINDTAKIVIGDRVRFGSYSSIRAAKSVTIGDDCMIAPCVRIFDYNSHPVAPFDPADPNRRRNVLETPRNEVRAVEIEENVWVGEHSFIQAGVTIGKNSIVGANSVVTKKMPANVIALGNPARVIMWLRSEKLNNYEN